VIRAEFVRRKLHLIAEDLGRLLHFRDRTLDELAGDFVVMAAVERLLERVVMRAIDVNQHILSELATGREERITRLTYRDTFLRLAEIGVYPVEFAEQIARSAGLRNILVHDYNDLDRSLVHNSINSCLRDYQRYVDYITNLLNHPSDNAK
jgi:uncharacterized protein YutE (UPF0331/DUF86 family)